MPRETKSCAVTFHNTGDSDIIVEPINEYGRQDDAVFVSTSRSRTTYLYPSNYRIRLYSKGYERMCYPKLQRWGVGSTSASISIGFNSRSESFLWTVNSVLKGNRPLFPPDEIDSSQERLEYRDPPEDDSDEESDSDGSSEDSYESESDGEPSYDSRYGLLDLVFIIDATQGRGNFLSNARRTIKASLQGLGRPFSKGNFRIGTVVTRDFTEEDSFSIVETTSFTSDVADFERELDAIIPKGGEKGFGAFNAGMKEALGSDIEWRDNAKKVVVLVTASTPHSIEYREDETTPTYIIEDTDPIVMARRMAFLGIKLCILADPGRIASEGSRTLCFYRALAAMASGSVHNIDSVTAIRNYIGDAMPQRWREENTGTVDELQPPDAVSRSSAYRSLSRIFSNANSLTDSEVQESLGIDEPLAAPMHGKIAFASVTFENNGRIKINLDVTDSNGKHTKKDLASRMHLSVKVQTYEKFDFVLKALSKTRRFSDRATGNKRIDVSKKI